MGLILDTDVLIDIRRRTHPEAVYWLSGVSEPLFVTCVAAGELLFGARSRAELHDVEKFLTGFSILMPVDADFELTFAHAGLKLTNGIGFLDLVTAAIALRHAMPLATFNVRHFRSVPGLLTIQPYDK